MKKEFSDLIKASCKAQELLNLWEPESPGLLGCRGIVLDELDTAIKSTRSTDSEYDEGFRAGQAELFLAIHKLTYECNTCEEVVLRIGGLHAEFARSHKELNPGLFKKRSIRLE